MLSFPTCIVSRASRTSYLLLCSTCLKLYLLSCLMPCVLSCQRVLSPTSCRESNARILLGAPCLHASFPMWFRLSRTSCLACFYASRVSCLMWCRAPRASCLTCLVPCVSSCFMKPFPDVLLVPRTLSSLFANITFCTLEFPYLMLLFFRTFLTWDIFGGYYFSNKDKKLIIEWSIAESASSWICGIRNYMKVFLSH